MAPRKKLLLLAGLSMISTLLLMFVSHRRWDSGSTWVGGAVEAPSPVGNPSQIITAATPPSISELDPTSFENNDCNPRIAPAQEEVRPLRWLFLQTKEDEDTRGDPFLIILYRGAKTSPLVKESVHWGPGYQGYNAATGLRENLKRQYGDEEYFDIIFFCGDLKGLIKTLVLEYTDSRVLVATRKHECRPKENCAGILGQTKADLSVNVNPFEVALNSELMKISEQMVLAHVFSPGLRSMHFAPVEQPRPVDGALMGAVSEAYPLRRKWRSVATQGVGHYNMKEYARPNRFQNKEKKTGASWIEHFAQYSERLQTAKILLTDAAWVFYSVQKYSEAPTAGALLVCDIPHDRMREFRHGSVEVSTKMSNQELTSTVKWWLDHPEELRKKATVGQDWALHHAQTAQFFEQVTEQYYEQVSSDYGGQGMVGRSFYSPFYVRCRGAGGEAWCNRQQQNKEPHYLSRGCGDETGTIAPHAYKDRWGKRNVDPNANTALRVLLLQTKEDADRIDIIDPLYSRLLTESDHSYRYAELVRWGPGWEGYRSHGASLLSNIAEKFGSEDYFDMIITDAETLPNETKEYKQRRTVVVVRRESCADDDCGNRLRAHAPSIVLLGNPFEILYNPSLQELSREALIVHAPRTSVRVSEPAISVAGSDTERTVDVLLVAKPSDGNRFPMQTLWQEAVQGMRSAGLTVETTTAAASAYLVSQLRRAKIVLSESTSRRYMPPEWEDALGSGCLLMSDMPAERMREIKVASRKFGRPCQRCPKYLAVYVMAFCALVCQFRRFSVEVPRTASPSQLALLVERWVQDTEARKRKTREGYEWAALNASPSHWLDDLIEDYWEVVRVPYGEGLVGKKFPWSFQASCRAEGGERWCKDPPKKIRPHWALSEYEENEGASDARSTVVPPAVAPAAIAPRDTAGPADVQELKWKLVRDQAHPNLAIWEGGSFDDQQCPARISAGAKADDVDCGCADDRTDPDPVTSCGQLCAKYYHSHGCRWFYINKRSGSDLRYTKKGRCCMKTKVDLTQGWRSPKDLPNYGNSGFYEMVPP